MTIDNEYPLLAACERLDRAMEKLQEASREYSAAVDALRAIDPDGSLTLSD